MTILEAKNRVLTLARSHIGFHEEYNNDNPFAKDPQTVKAYGGSMNNLPWCDIFCDYLFCRTFGAELAKQMTYQTSGMSAACARSMELYRENWAVFQTPQIGDQIFFYSGGGVNHTGIVEDVAAGMVTTIEGNTSDAVLRRVYSIGDKTIAGYGRPNWELVLTDEDDDPAPADAKAEEPEQKEYSYLHLCPGDGMGAPDERVEWLQHGLRLHGATIDADGEFGPMTEQAVRNFRLSRDIGDSGETDQAFWEELIKFEV